MSVTTDAVPADATVPAIPEVPEVPGAEPLLRLAGIGVRFGGIAALHEVACTVGRGEILGLIGPNGAGKTTLFDVISGVRRPNEGTVTFAGRDVTGRNAVARARVGMRRTFQRVQTFGWLTVEDNVLTATEWRGGGGGPAADLVRWPGRVRRERRRRDAAALAIERCGLTSVKDELASSLPIGLARMVELARALVDQPSLLLLDEPASGLDATEAERLGRILHDERDERGCSILLVEHDAPFVMGHCDRIVVLAQGQVLAEGAPTEIRRDPRVRRAYLGEEIA
jgi:branched-chain amino acid transport system ATP-binding protein